MSTIVHVNQVGRLQSNVHEDQNSNCKKVRMYKKKKFGAKVLLEKVIRLFAS